MLWLLPREVIAVVSPGQLSTLVHSMKYIYVIFYFKFLLGELFAMRKKHTFSNVGDMS